MVSTTEIKSLIIEALGIRTMKVEDIADDALLRGDRLPIDSLDLFTLTATIDETYGVSFSDDDLYSIKTVADLTDYINRARSITAQLS